MSNVFELESKREVATKAEPDQDLIRLLEETLEMARSGQLQCFIGTGFTFEGLRYSMWCDTHENYFEMLGAVASLKSEWTIRRDKLVL